MSDPTDKPAIREVITDALRFWEWRRLFYNIVLAAIVILEFARHWPASSRAFDVHAALSLFVLAMFANGAYCAAYLVEALVQYSDFREPWRRRRIALWLLGTAFAAVLAYFFSEGFFAPLLPDRFGTAPLLP